MTALVYADTETFMGADPEPTLDHDDELVFMARDAGDRIETWAEPDGVVAGSGVELEVVDGDARGYVYLFAREDAGLDPGAGAQYVSYSFALEGGIDYKTQYDLHGYSCGGNDAICDPSMTEDSTVEGATYSMCDDSVENELSCAPDCWPQYAGVVACADNACGGLVDACADQDECVDVVTCVGTCVADNNPPNQCISDCVAMVMPTQDNTDVANQLLTCVNMAGCF